MTSDKSTTGLQTAHTRTHTHTHTHLHFDSRHQPKLSHTPKLIMLLIRTDAPSLQIMTLTINQACEMWGDITEELSWRSAVELSCYCTHFFVGLFFGGDTYTNSYVSLCTYSPFTYSVMCARSLKAFRCGQNRNCGTAFVCFLRGTLSQPPPPSPCLLISVNSLAAL